MRSVRKQEEILAANAAYASQLDFAIVPDMALPGAFDDAVKAEPGLTCVVHTASPFRFTAQDLEKGRLAPLSTLPLTNNHLRDAPPGHPRHYRYSEFRQRICADGYTRHILEQVHKSSLHRRKPHLKLPALPQMPIPRCFQALQAKSIPTTVGKHPKAWFVPHSDTVTDWNPITWPEAMNDPGERYNWLFNERRCP